jgi:hypothetical protein
MRGEDGVSFTHIAIYESDQAREAAAGNDAFQAFVADIGDRCTVPPNAVAQTIIADHDLFSA